MNKTIKISVDSIILDIIEYIIVIMSIIVSSSVWVQKEVKILNTYTCLFSCYFLVIVYILIRRFKLNNRMIIMMLFIEICMFASVILHSQFYLSILLIIAMVTFSCIFGMACYSCGRLNIIYTKFVNVACVLSLISLIFYIIVHFFNWLKPTRYYVLKWSWVSKVPSYYDLYYDAMPAGLDGRILARNCGIFPESPMFMYPLCLALMLNELLIENRSVKKTIILLIAIVSSFSSTGFIIIILLLTYKLIKRKKKVITLKTLLIPLIIFMGLFWAYDVFIARLSTGSGRVRIDHVYACLKAFSSTMGLGCGIGNELYVERFMTYKQGASVGLLHLLATGGILWGMVYLVPWIKGIVVSIKHRNLNKVVFSVLFFILLFMTACHLKINTWFIFGVTIFTWSYSTREIESKEREIESKEREIESKENIIIKNYKSI